MRVLLLSAYDAQSHRYWRESLKSGLPQLDWVELTLPPRHFSWRIRGNALSWGVNASPVFTQAFDICLATSMVDLATLRGLVPSLTDFSTILYFHENQFCYPLAGAHTSSRLEAQMVQLYSALCADKLVFNSEYNRSSFLSGVGDLLSKFPDCVPSGIASALRQKSALLAVPITPPARAGALPTANSFIWNHRWEYDKGPERLLAFIQAMPPERELTFHIVGQQFRQIPDVFYLIRDLLKKRGWLGEWGYVDDREAYHALLERSRFVLSTAEHDFQGVAVLEAVAAGCVPVLPNRLAYPEIFPSEYLYQSHEDCALEADNMTTKVLGLMSRGDSLVVPDIRSYGGDQLLPRYLSLFKELVNRT